MLRRATGWHHLYLLLGLWTIENFYSIGLLYWLLALFTFSKLLNQHKKFSELHSKDSFSKNYFKWLGHYEFGAGHLPFNVNNTTQSNPFYELNDINYWLCTWINVYSYLFSFRNKERCYFLCFESLCKNPAETFEQPLNYLDITVNSDFLSKLIILPKEMV